MPLIIALMATLLMSALGAALVLTTSSDALIAANFRTAQEGVYAADAALERAMADLGTLSLTDLRRPRSSTGLRAEFEPWPMVRRSIWVKRSTC